MYWNQPICIGENSALEQPRWLYATPEFDPSPLLLIPLMMVTSPIESFYVYIGPARHIESSSRKRSCYNSHHAFLPSSSPESWPCIALKKGSYTMDPAFGASQFGIAERRLTYCYRQSRTSLVEYSEWALYPGTGHLTWYPLQGPHSHTIWPAAW